MFWKIDSMIRGVTPRTNEAAANPPNTITNITTTISAVSELDSASGAKATCVTVRPRPAAVAVAGLKISDASSRVLLHPALHDEAPLSVAEALSLGTPIVALDHAGPAAIAAHWPKEMSRLVFPTTPDATARQLARAVDGFLDDGLDMTHPPRRFNFDEALLNIYRSAYEASQVSPEV